MPYPTKPKGGWQRPRQVVVNTSTAQIWEKKATRKFANKYRDVFRTIRWRDPEIPGSVSLPRRRQNLCLPSHGDVTEYSEEPVVRENEKGLPGRRNRNPQDNTGKGPCNPCVNPTGIFTKGGSRDNASDGQSEGNGRKRDPEQSDEVHDDGVS